MNNTIHLPIDQVLADEIVKLKKRRFSSAANAAVLLCLNRVDMVPVKSESYNRPIIQSLYENQVLRHMRKITPEVSD